MNKSGILLKSPFGLMRAEIVISSKNNLYINIFFKICCLGLLFAATTENSVFSEQVTCYPLCVFLFNLLFLSQFAFFPDSIMSPPGATGLSSITPPFRNTS